MAKNSSYVQMLEDENKKNLAGNQETPLVVSSDNASGSTILPESAKSGGYVSPYAQQIEQAMSQVQNSAFQYNREEDPNWQAMRKQYLLEAERSMKDTLGQASAATGGRASTAAINAASQAADYYKSQLNAQQQTLYQAAYERYYNQFTQDLNKLSALQQQDATAYQQYLDEQNAQIAEQERADAAQNTAYERLVTLIMNTGHSPSAEELAAANMSASEASSWKRYYQNQLANSGGGSSGGGGSSYYNYGYDTSTVKAAQNYVGTTADGKWGSNSTAAAAAMGYGSLAEVIAAMNNTSSKSNAASAATTASKATSTASTAKYTSSELLAAAASGYSYSEIIAMLAKRGVDTSSAAVQADVKWALSK